ncbi:MAG: hypothetical protein LBL45_06390 [Treponema sp.]|jgi:hypothetical protein|nr:hypothetical protein [Treponema sp.]
MADSRERETLQLFDLMFKLILKEAIPAAWRTSSMGCSTRVIRLRAK